MYAIPVHATYTATMTYPPCDAEMTIAPSRMTAVTPDMKFAMRSDTCPPAVSTVMRRKIAVWITNIGMRASATPIDDPKLRSPSPNAPSGRTTSRAAVKLPGSRTSL